MLGEEENYAACLACIRGRNVKVEDGAVAATDVGIVLGAVRLGGGLAVNRDDGVRSLVSAGK